MPESRAVTYDLEMHDELPERVGSTGTNSVLEDQLKRIAGNPQHYAPRWGRIGRYANSAAASSAAAVLRKRHGDTAEVEGWRFEVRRIDNGEATGLFAQFDPKAVIPGKREENQVRYEVWKQRQKEARNRQASEQAVKDAQAHADANKVPAKAGK